MTVREYLKKKNVPFPDKGYCPLAMYAFDPLLWKMAKECCESSGKGDCVPHFLSAELGDVG